MPAFNTWLTRTTGVKYPFIQGGLMNVGNADLAAAVSNAGALGFITAFMFETPEDLRNEIRRCKKLTNKPFGVNFTLLPAISPPDYVACAQVAVDEGIWIFETAGNPKPVIPTLRKVPNAVLIHKCISIRHALKAEKAGVSAVTIDGFECAGHPGEDEVTSLILLARARQVLKVPILASGGFADGKTCAAAFALGAQGVNMGSRWLATKEAPIHQDVKDTIVKAQETDTAVILKTLNNAVRCYNNKVAKAVIAEESKTEFKFENVASLMSGKRGKKVYETGDSDYGIWSLGQSAGLIYDVPSCQELVQRLAKETAESLKEGYSIIGDEAHL